VTLQGRHAAEPVRVVVTGLGCISPLGATVEQTWQGMLAGRSGIRRVDRFDPSAFASQIAGCVPDFDTTAVLDAREARRLDRVVQLAVVSAAEAIRDAGLDFGSEDTTRVGVVVSSGSGGIGSLADAFAAMAERGPSRISPFVAHQMLVDGAAGQISIVYGLKGPNLAVVSACATGGHSIGEAAAIIARGDADVMLAGGTEAPVLPIGLGVFSAVRGLSTHFNDCPTQSPRPFDLRRDGFVLAEGAGVLVLERLDHALARGARSYAELVGYGLSADANHVTAPPEDGDGAYRAMRMALAKADVAPEQVGYINAHGTATQLGDIAEARAIERLFGVARRVPVSSTKSMTGHLLGAAGGVEAIAAILALRDGMLPPTINCDDLDPACPLDVVPGQARPARLDVTLSNSFGFGGHNASLLFRRMPA
jgi:3-oxoacyl-[acyl-carrier-protein] synthase II